jgi:hypothetical protein
VEFTDIKIFSRHFVRETQQIGFYDGQFFLLATTNIFHERQHAYLGPYIYLPSIRERISASFNDHYPLSRQLLGKGLDNCEIEVYFRRWQKFLSSVYRPHQLWWPPNISNGYQSITLLGIIEPAREADVSRFSLVKFDNVSSYN